MQDRLRGQRLATPLFRPGLSGAATPPRWLLLFEGGSAGAQTSPTAISTQALSDAPGSSTIR